MGYEIYKLQNEWDFRHYKVQIANTDYRTFDFLCLLFSVQYGIVQ